MVHPYLSPLNRRVDRSKLALTFRRTTIRFEAVTSVQVTQGVPGQATYARLKVPNARHSNTSVNLSTNAHTRQTQLGYSNRHTVNRVPNTRNLNHLARNSSFNINGQIAVDLAHIMSTPSGLTNHVRRRHAGQCIADNYDLANRFRYTTRHLIVFRAGRYVPFLVSSRSIRGQPRTWHFLRNSRVLLIRGGLERGTTA